MKTTAPGEVKNALIESTMLGTEDHGILTCYLHLDYGGTAQGFGGYSFDEYDKARDTRIGTAYGCEFIRRILETVGVGKWEDLPGKYVRVKAEWTKVLAIGHIIEDKWFSPDDLKPFLTDDAEASS